jgi:fermentation-respiration switch protein FrsA (DUF1100 family)
VLLRLLHEAPGWSGAALFLAGAGVKLTPHRTLPRNQRVLLIHGSGDDIVPLGDSCLLADSSPQAVLRVVDDGHRLSSILSGSLDAAIEELLGPAGPAVCHNSSE